VSSDGYKDTKIGRFPEEWDIVKISQIAKTSSGGTPNRKIHDYYNGNILWVKTGELKSKYLIKTEEHITSKAILESSAKLFPVGTLLIAMYGATIGKSSILKVDATCNQACCAIMSFPNSTINEYLYYILDYRINRLISLGDGGAQPNISQALIKLFEIPLPSLHEQRKIAEILSTIDEAIEKTDRIIEETKQLKKGLMQRLFTEGIGHTRFKDTKIGRIPEEWEVKSLGEIGHFFKGKTITKAEITDSGYPCIRYGDIYVQYKDNVVVTHFSAYISVKSAKNGKLLIRGDIIFAGTGETAEDIGKCVAYNRDNEAYAGGDLVVLRPNRNTEINSVFLSYSLNTGAVLNRKSRLGQGLSIFHIYSSHLQVLEIPIPLLDEQNQITEILSDFDLKIEKEQATKDQLEQLKKGLMQVLLTGKVRVKF